MGIEFRRYNVNYRISAPKVRLIDDDGQQLGIVLKDEAIKKAKEKFLDLVEIVPDAKPPVCRIIDFKKFLYEQKKKKKEANKHLKQTQLKEIRLTPEISEHDYGFKKAHIEEFLKEGHKVKVSVFFRGRSILHKNRGYQILQKLMNELSAVAKIEKNPKEEHRTLSIVVIPHK